MDHVSNDGEFRRRRRKKKRMDEESIDSVSTISKIVEEGEVIKENVEDVNKKKKPTRESSLEEYSHLQTKKKKKKTKKTIETNKEESHDDNSSIQKRKIGRRKKKRNSVSSDEGYLGEEKLKLKRKNRTKITDSQSLHKEDFYSDPQLATTLQGK